MVKCWEPLSPLLCMHESVFVLIVCQALWRYFTPKGFFKGAICFSWCTYPFPKSASPVCVCVCLFACVHVCECMCLCVSVCVCLLLLLRLLRVVALLSFCPQPLWEITWYLSNFLSKSYLGFPSLVCADSLFVAQFFDTGLAQCVLLHNRYRKCRLLTAWMVAGLAQGLSPSGRQEVSGGRLSGLGLT